MYAILVIFEDGSKLQTIPVSDYKTAQRRFYHIRNKMYDIPKVSVEIIEIWEQRSWNKMYGFVQLKLCSK